MTKEAALQHRNDYAPVIGDKLLQKPVEMPTSQVVKDYNAGKQKVLAEPFREQVWVQFLEQLQGWQLELEKYQEKGGKVSTSLGQEISFCQLVIDTWPDIEPLLRERPAP